MTPEILKTILTIAVKMTMVGSEISRVEESVERMCSAYGAVRTDVYATTSSIMTSVEKENGEIITQTRNINKIALNIEKLDKLNSIVRWISDASPEISEINKKLLEAENVKTPSWRLTLLYYGLISFAFCVFFGSRNVAEIVSSFFLGVLVGILNEGLERAKANKLLTRFISCAVAAFIIKFLIYINLFSKPDYITIGIIMTVIPGAGITNALRDLFSGDSVTGVLRLIEAILIAAAIAIGFAMPSILLGGVM